MSVNVILPIWGLKYVRPVDEKAYNQSSISTGKKKRLEEISTHVAFCSSDPMEFTQLWHCYMSWLKFKFAERTDGNLDYIF